LDHDTLAAPLGLRIQPAVLVPGRHLASRHSFVVLFIVIIHVLLQELGKEKKEIKLVELSTKKLACTCKRTLTNGSVTLRKFCFPWGTAPLLAQ
jgi:hypothetical protein